MKIALRIKLMLIVAAITLIAVICCSTTKHEMVWTNNNIMKIRQGMTTEQIIAMFGPPDKQSVNSYGVLTTRPWQGLHYEYHFWKNPWKDEFCINTFTFVLMPDPVLNDWDIRCAY